MKLKQIVMGAGALAVAAGLAWWWFAPPPNRPVRKVKIERKAKRTWNSPEEAVRETLAGKVEKSKKGKAHRSIGQPKMFLDMKPGDRKIAESVQNALDANDFEGVRKFVSRAMASSDPALREHMVEALGWFGAEALPELTGFLADTNEDVANLAADRWQESLVMIDEGDVRVSTAETALKTISNAAVLEQVVGEITGQDDDIKVLESLIAVIDSGNPAGVKVAKDAYETLTGEEWTDIDAAEAWLGENYTAPDEVVVRRKKRK